MYEINICNKMCLWKSYLEFKGHKVIDLVSFERDFIRKWSMHAKCKVYLFKCVHVKVNTYVYVKSIYKSI